MQTSIVIHVAGPAATSVTFTPAAGTLRAPVLKGAVLGTIEIQPAPWTGNITVSGADAAMIGLDANFHVVALADMTAARDYTVTVTAVE